MNEELFPLIVNLSTKNRYYVVFVGAGFSKDAGVKSSWEILIETLKPLYLIDKGAKQLPEEYMELIEEWYLNNPKYKQLGYSEILGLLYKGDLEIREYLKQFFKDAIPGETHRQLAELVAKGYIRFIFTTNFDDLIEKSLDDINIDYDVIYEDKILEASISWDKVRTCRIYKLHGDYKTGKIKNTLKELESLDPLLSDDFQYIIDRYGLIVIGYAGRDKGVMQHFLNRKPHAYPFYWQYVKLPEKNEEFKYFFKLIEKYKKVHGREIILIKNNSASKFLKGINDGIEKLKLQIITKKKDEDYRSFITHENDKKIHALTIELINRFQNIYDDYCKKEDNSIHYNYRFDIFEEYIDKIDFIFNWLNELCLFKFEVEFNYFMKSLIEFCIKYYYQSNDFIISTTPYYLILCFTSILLKNDLSNEIEKFFKFEYKARNDYRNLLSEISRFGEGWNSIKKERNYNYQNVRYSVLENHIPKEIISVNEFSYADAFFTLDILFEAKNIDWFGSSVFYYETYSEIYHKYFSNRIYSKELAEQILKRISDYIEKNYSFGYRYSGLEKVYLNIKERFFKQ